MIVTWQRWSDGRVLVSELTVGDLYRLKGDVLNVNGRKTNGEIPTKKKGADLYRGN